MTLGSLYSSFMRRAELLRKRTTERRRSAFLWDEEAAASCALVMALMAASLFAIEIPRKAPEFVINTGPNKQLLVSQYRGKVLCLVFILTT
jgi:hypothetical protein